MSGVRYVDLGLGTHRVKCRIHKNFRLVLIAEDQVTKGFRFPRGHYIIITWVGWLSSLSGALLAVAEFYGCQRIRIRLTTFCECLLYTMGCKYYNL